MKAKKQDVKGGARYYVVLRQIDGGWSNFRSVAARSGAEAIKQAAGETPGEYRAFPERSDCRATVEADTKTVITVTVHKTAVAEEAKP